MIFAVLSVCMGDIYLNQNGYVKRNIAGKKRNIHGNNEEIRKFCDAFHSAKCTIVMMRRTALTERQEPLLIRVIRFFSTISALS
jgi:hypothetical protein